MVVGDFRDYTGMESSRNSRIMSQLMKLSEKISILSSSQLSDEQKIGAIQTALIQLNLSVVSLGDSITSLQELVNTKMTALSGSARSLKILPDVVKSYSSILSIVLAGDRSYELVCTGALTTDTILPYVKSAPSGFRLVRAVPTATDRVTVTIAEPALAVGFTGTMTVGLVALR